MYFFDTVFPIVFFIIFVMVFGIVLTVFFRGIREWNRNNHSPRLTVTASVVSKRTHYTRHSHHHHSSTTYYVTFQVESGDRMELHVTGMDYGMLAEGDQGRLCFQGTRFLSFERTGF